MVLLAGICACSAPPLAPRTSQFPGLTIELDESPTWSHDGRSIAFHRRIPSSYGPAGVYTTTPFGGEPRLLAPGSLYFPTDLTFSPDDRYLAGVDGYQLWICEVATGIVTRPMYTGQSVFKPDWSPDGRLILYARVYASPPDSGGIRILDLEAGSDTALKVDGQLIGTTEPPLWTRDGNWVGCVERYGTDPRKFSLIKVDGSERRVVIGSALGDWWNPRRYYRPAHGRDGFLFSQQVASVPESGAYYVHADGSGLVRTSKRFIFMRAFSPDGSEYVWGSADPSVANYVLAVFQTDDATGTSRRPITRYEPPPGQTLAEALAPLARAARDPHTARLWRQPPRR